LPAPKRINYRIERDSFARYPIAFLSFFHVLLHTKILQQKRQIGNFSSFLPFYFLLVPRRF